MTPISSGLPPGWRFAALGDLGEWGGGGTPSKSRRSFWADGDIPWVSPKDMKFDAINGSLDKITQDAVENSSTNLYPVDTVLMVTRSAILYHTLPVAKTLTEVTINQDLKALVPNGFVDTDYLVAAIRAHSDQILRECRKAGTTVCSIEFPVLKAFELPVAPLNEQRRIVAKIEDLSARSRAAKEALDAIPPLLERFRQSVLAAAFRGDLTKQWREQNPNVEPASALLDRIRQERRHRWEEDYLAQQKAKGKTPKDDKWKAKYQEPEPVDTTDLPELPEGWCWANTDELLIESPVNGKSLRGSELPPGIPVLRLNAMSDNGFDYSVVQYINLSADLQRRLSVKAGDFFVSRGNGTLSLVGRGTLATEPPRLTTFPDTMIRMRPHVDVQGWVSTIWSCPQTRRQIEQKAKTTAGIFKVSQDDLKSIVLPVPPLSEIRNALAAVSTLLDGNSGLKAAMRELRKLNARLNQSILAKAFRGELVPQDPNDEPASVLLERIRAEREAKTAGDSGKKRKARK